MQYLIPHINIRQIQPDEPISAGIGGLMDQLDSAKASLILCILG